MSVIEITAPKFEDSQIDMVRKIKGVGGVTKNNGFIDVMVESPELAEDINIALVGAGCRVRGIREKMPTLEDAFLKVTAEGNVEG